MCSKGSCPSFPGPACCEIPWAGGPPRSLARNSLTATPWLAPVLGKQNPVCFNLEAVHYPRWLAYQAAFAKLDASRVHLAILRDWEVRCNRCTGSAPSVEQLRLVIVHADHE